MQMKLQQEKKTKIQKGVYKRHGKLYKRFNIHVIGVPEREEWDRSSYLKTY